MATFLPHVGLGASLIFGGAVGLFYQYKLTRIGRTPGEAISAMVPKKSSSSRIKMELEEQRRDREIGKYHYPAHIALVHGFVMFLAASCVAFVILNPALQVSLKTSLSREQAWREMRRQWANGILVLRLSTVWFCGVVVSRQAYRYLGSGFPGSNRIDIATEFTEDFEGVSTVVGEANRRLRDFLQSAIFVFSLSAIWLVYADGIKSPVIAIISWSFVFFCDDWQIISAYSEEVKGRILKWHRRRINSANALLVLSISYLIVEQAGAAVMAWLILILPLLTIRYGGLHESEEGKA